MRSICLVLVLACFVLEAQVDAQGRFARLRGTLVDASTASPVVGARVSLVATGRTVLTDSSGRFEVADIPTGVIRLMFSADGFPRVSLALAFAAGETMVQRFEIDSTAAVGDTLPASRRVQRLDPTTVTASPSRGVRYEDFERRMKSGRGQYVTREQIAAAGYASLTDVARTLRGVNVECGGGRECYIRMARAQRGCLPEYIVDGVVDQFFGPQVAISDIEGVELYTGASDVPGEFAGRNAGCGVVVIWTRNGPAKAPPAAPPASKPERPAGHPRATP